MNKELIKKYKPEFEHWLNGGKLLIKLSTGWEPVPLDYAWHLTSKLIIIDDEYVELRKALAEGKTIQVYDVIYQHLTDPKLDTYGWKDFKSFTKSSTFTHSPETYRIKPEEPKFKVGDWVRDGKNIYKFIEPSSTYSYELSLNRCELWQPKLNDWCWFYDIPHYDMPVLQKFVTTIGDYYIALNDFNSKHTNLESVPSFEKGISHSYNKWKYCEPFLGTLPSTLKD